LIFHICACTPVETLCNWLANPELGLKSLDAIMSKPNQNHFHKRLMKSLGCVLTFQGLGEERTNWFFYKTKLHQGIGITRTFYHMMFFGGKK